MGQWKDLVDLKATITITPYEYHTGEEGFEIKCEWKGAGHIWKTRTLQSAVDRILDYTMYVPNPEDVTDGGRYTE